MKDLVIVVEMRRPKYKDEKGLYGHCFTRGPLSRIYIDATRERQSRADTFFHEITHAFIHWRDKTGGKKAERVALAVGRAAAKAYKKALRG